MAQNQKEYHKEYYSRAEVKERQKAYMEEYYQKNKEKLKKDSRKYRKQKGLYADDGNPNRIAGLKAWETRRKNEREKNKIKEV